MYRFLLALWVVGVSLAAVAAPAPTGWKLVYSDPFDRRAFAEIANDLRPWVVVGGRWKIQDGALQRDGGRGNAMVFHSKRFPGNQRIEFDCRATETQDFFVILCGARQHWTGGYLFAYSVGKPSDFRVTDKTVVRGLPGGELGKWHHVVCQVEDYEVSWWADGKLLLKRAYAPALRGPIGGHIGFYCYAATGRIDNVKIYTRPAGNVGKDRAEKLDIRKPAARPISETPMHDTDYVPSLEYVTPHIPYGKPYAQGPVNALLCAWACSGRTVVELHQRMDLKFDYVSAGSNNRVWRGYALKRVQDDEVARVKMLLKKSHDVIVLGAVHWTWYPEDVRAEILRQVEAGTGLVYSHTRMPTQADGPLFTLFQRAKPVDSAKQYFPSDRARVTTHGKGRVAFEVLSPRYVNDSFLRYFSGMEESGVERLARTLLWAAKKEPKAAPTLADLAAKPADGTLTLDIYRDLGRQYPMLYGRMPYQFRPYATFERVASVTAPGVVPSLPAGAYRFTLTLRDAAGRVAAWRNIAREVKSPAAVLEIRVGGRDGRPVRANEVPPPVSFTAQDTLHAEALAPVGVAGSIRLTLFDRDHRVLARETRPLRPVYAAAMAARFALPLHRALHRLVIVKAELLGGGRVLAENRAPVVLDERPERVPAFRMRCYGCSLLRPELTTYDISYRKGYRVSVADAALQHAWHDMQLGEFSHVVPLAKGISDDFVRTPSFHDPAFRERQKQWVRDFLKPVAGVGFNLLLCDEWTYAFFPQHRLLWPKAANQDQSEFSRRAFRAYLKRQYGDLKALNAEWGRNYTAWEQITPPLYDPDPAKAPPEKDWPHIIDHRAFVEKTVADFIREIADVAHAISPAIRIGTSGHYSVGMWTGRDYYLWAKYAPHIVTYREHELWQSFTPQRVAAWIGYGAELRNPVKENYRAWKNLFQGIERAYWGRAQPPFQPDFTLLDAPKQYFAQRREMRDRGIADLLMNARGANRIGILYHPKSFVLYNLKDWQQNGADYFKRVARINRYGGYLGRYMERFPVGTYHWVHTDQFIRGDFGEYGRPGVVLLPQTEILAPEEAEALRRYVAEGGILVADRNPGVRDAHGKRLPKGQLDDVFGLAVGKAGAAFHVHPFGKGKAVYLGAVPQNLETFDRIREIAGLLPGWTADRGDPEAIVMVRDYRRGGHLYFGCTGNHRLDAKTLTRAKGAITLAKPAHVYDVRRGKYLGRTKTIEVRFGPDWMGNVFAALP